MTRVIHFRILGIDMGGTREAAAFRPLTAGTWCAARSGTNHKRRHASVSSELNRNRYPGNPNRENYAVPRSSSLRSSQHCDHGKAITPDRGIELERSFINNTAPTSAPLVDSARPDRAKDIQRSQPDPRPGSPGARRSVLRRDCLSGAERRVNRNSHIRPSLSGPALRHGLPTHLPRSA